MENTHEPQATSTKAPTKHVGSCHCGAVRFEVEIAPDVTPTRCNCSVCTRISQVSSIVKPAAFKLLAGEDMVTRYAWRSELASRSFCKRCGVHCFGDGDIPQLGGPFVSVNWNCFEDIDVGAVKVLHWDGAHDNWMAGPRDTAWPVDLPARNPDLGGTKQAV